MKKIIISGVRFMALPLYALSHLFPRKKNRWLFGEPHGFNNNSKYMFLNVVENHPEIDAIWIGDKTTVTYLRTHGFKAFYRFSMKGIYLCFTSKVYVVSWTTSDINFYTSGGAFIVNLWHGIGWKKCLWAEPENEIHNTKHHKFNFWHYINSTSIYHKPNIVLSSSKYFSEHFFAPTFNVTTDRCIEALYPRCEFMCKEKDEIKKYLQKFGFTDTLDFIEDLSQFNSVYLYAPTFRDDGSDFVEKSGIDFNKLNGVMKGQNALFIVKFHPATMYNKDKIGELSNVVFLDHKYDLYPIMPFTDVLISDYSSILVDYLLLDKKIVLFTFDYVDYIMNCRDFIVDFDKTTNNFIRVTNFENMLELITNGIPPVDNNTKRFFWDSKDNIILKVKEHVK